MFGDMQMSPFQYVKSSAQFDQSKWPLSNSATLSPQVSFHFHLFERAGTYAIENYQANLLHNLEKMREDHIKYACELSR